MFKQVKDTLGNVYPFGYNTRKGNYIFICTTQCFSHFVLPVEREKFSQR